MSQQIISRNGEGKEGSEGLKGGGRQAAGREREREAETPNVKEKARVLS